MLKARNDPDLLEKPVGAEYGGELRMQGFDCDSTIMSVSSASKTAAIPPLPSSRSTVY